MRTLLILLILAALFAPAISRADITSGPDYSLLWNQFNAIKVFDGYALVTSDFGLAVLQFDSTHNYFTQVNQLILDNQATDVSVAGNLATVTSSAGLLYFVDISQLPELTLIGEMDPGTTVHDAVLSGNDLYLACGFQGLRHFTLDSTGGVQFVDSSLAPIHCIQVETAGPYLLVLDDYNGLLRFEPAVSGITQVESRIMIPRRAKSFIVTADTLFLPLVDNQRVYRATFDGFPHLIDSFSFTIIPEQILAVDSFLVAIDTELRFIEMTSTVHGGSVMIPPLSNLGLNPLGDTYHYRGDPYVVFISSSLGLVGFNLKDLWSNPSPLQLFDHPGPIDALAFHDQHLFTGGLRNPMESYQLASVTEPKRDTVLSSYLGVDALASAGGFTFVHLATTNRVQTLRFSNDSITTVSSLSTSARPFKRLKYYEYPANDTASLLILIGLTSVDVVAVGQNGTLSLTDIARTVEIIGDAIVIDSFLLVSTVDRQLHAFRIFNSFRAVYWWSASTPGSLDHMVFTGDRHTIDGSWQSGIGLGFDGNQMYKITLRSDGFPIAGHLGSLPVEVTASAPTADALYTIGPQGVGVLDIRSDEPSLVTYGGYGGDLVAFGDSVLAVSDGTAIHLYSYRDSSLAPSDDTSETVATESHLGLNYPNPFNPSTRIDFYVSEPGRVEITVFDILGRRVKSLIKTDLTTGTHSVIWDGTSRSGEPVASGVYFYRMTTPLTSEARKMVLLK